MYFLKLCIVFLVLFEVAGQISSPGAISSFSPGGQYVMLTFDDGPHSTLTPKLLDILKKSKVKATFFVIGSKAVDRPEILRRIANEGHEVASHGWNHVPFTKIEREKLHHQLLQTKKLVANLTSSTISVIRPPFGSTNAQINDFIKERMNMKVILWSIDSKDLEEKDPKVISKKIISKTKPGDVIRCHDGSAVMLEALPTIIEEFYKAGYEFITLSQVLSFPDDTPHRRLTHLRS